MFQCTACGFQSDGPRNPKTQEPVQPKLGDLSTCIGCGVVYRLRHRQQWTRLTAGERAALPIATRQTLQLHETIRLALVEKD